MHLIFIGGYGKEMFLSWTKNETDTYTLVDTDEMSLKQCSETITDKCNINCVCLFKEELGGFGCGGNPEKFIEASLKKVNELISPIEQEDRNIIIAGTAGGTGSGFIQSIAKVNKKLKAEIKYCASLPFSFEGKNKSLISNKTVSILKKYKSDYSLIDVDKISKDTGKDVTVQELTVKIINEMYRCF